MVLPWWQHTPWFTAGLCITASPRHRSLHVCVLGEKNASMQVLYQRLIPLFFKSFFPSFLSSQSLSLLPLPLSPSLSPTPSLLTNFLGGNGVNMPWLLCVLPYDSLVRLGSAWAFPHHLYIHKQTGRRQSSGFRISRSASSTARGHGGARCVTLGYRSPALKTYGWPFVSGMDMDKMLDWQIEGEWTDD